MKKVIAFAAMLLLTATTVSAKIVDFGFKAGANLTNMSLSADALEASNNAGFYVGPTCKFTLPVVGLGFDLSLVYDQRSCDVTNDQMVVDGETIQSTTEKVTAKKIAIPLNIRYNLIGSAKIAALYVYGGPQIDFNVGSKDAIKNTTFKSSSFSANIGFGLMMLSHLQVTANYNVAMGKTGDQDWSSVLGTMANVKTEAANTALNAVMGNFKSNSWQIGLAYYF